MAWQCIASYRSKLLRIVYAVAFSVIQIHIRLIIVQAQNLKKVNNL